MIACNLAFTKLPNALAVCFWDSSFWRYYKQSLIKFPGWKITTKGGTLVDADKYRIAELDQSFNHNVNNTGHFALSVAVHIAERVFLLGYDMTPNKEDVENWYKYPAGFYRAGFERYIEAFDEFRGKNVYNCIVNSFLPQFDFVDIRDVL